MGEHIVGWPLGTKSRSNAPKIAFLNQFCCIVLSLLCCEAAGQGKYQSDFDCLECFLIFASDP